MEDLKKIKVELEEWRLFYNNVLGALAFTFALACLSIPAYLAAVASTASFCMIGIIGDSCSPRFSPTLKLLRIKLKKSEREREILGYAEEQFLSNKRYLAFNFGMASLMVVWVYTLLPVGLWIWTTFSVT